MSRKLVVSALLLAAVLFNVAPVSAQTTVTCASCGITNQNIKLWWLVDANCSGGLTTYALVLFQKFAYATGPIIFAEDLDDFFTTQTDVNGDGVFDAADVQILNGLRTYFMITGQTQVSVEVLNACLRLVILGICP